MNRNRWKAQNRKNRSRGDAGEHIAARAMREMGLLFITRINTPWRIHRNAQGNIVNASPVGKVPGDWRAVVPGGRSVMAEVKTKNDDRLTYSTVEKHQHMALHNHHAAGGLSLVIWVHERIPYVMEYPIAGFKPRTSISIEQAKALCIRESFDNDN